MPGWSGHGLARWRLGTAHRTLWQAWCCAFFACKMEPGCPEPRLPPAVRAGRAAGAGPGQGTCGGQTLPGGLSQLRASKPQALGAKKGDQSGWQLWGTSRGTWFGPVQGHSCVRGWGRAEGPSTDPRELPGSVVFANARQGRSTR